MFNWMVSDFDGIFPDGWGNVGAKEIPLKNNLI